MEILQSDHRRLGLSAAVVVIFIAALVGLSLLSRSRNTFEREQANAEASNPKWIKVEIATADNRREYRQGEPIFVVAHFSSAMPYKYKADAGDGISEAAATDLLHLSNGELRHLNITLIVCCGSRLIGLDDQPFTPPSRTPLRLAPGEYEIYLTSRRVFKWDEGDYHASSFEVASNLLKIRVVPDSGPLHRD